VLVIHSEDDARFPFAENGQRLFDLAPSPKQLLRIHGAHGAGQMHATVNPTFFADIATFLNTQAGLTLRQPLPSVAPVIAAAIDSAGAEAAAVLYRQLTAENPPRYNFREAELERLAATLLEKQKVDDAIAVLRLNTEHFPQSYAVFESLGDAYVAAGKNAEAEENYKRSLNLLPGAGNNSGEKLARLQGKAKGDPRDLARFQLGV
jgi:tetratricopeptide (TPR) repeat protein